MPKVKSDKKPASIVTNLNNTTPTVINYPPLQPAPPIALVSPTKSDSMSLAHPGGALLFQKQRLNEEEHALLQNPPYQLTLSLNELLSPARKNRKNKSKPENKIPRPQNAWVLFRKDYEANQRMRFPDKALKMKNVSTDAGDVWRNQPSKVKRFFEILSRLAHEQHKALYPGYKYTPKKKVPKETNKDWIFHDSVKQTNDAQALGGIPVANNTITSDVTVRQIETPIKTSPHYDSSPLSSPLSSTTSSMSPGCSSPVFINSPTSPVDSFVSPSPCDMGFLFSSTPQPFPHVDYTNDLTVDAGPSNFGSTPDGDDLFILGGYDFRNADYETFQHLIQLAQSVLDNSSVVYKKEIESNKFNMEDNTNVIEGLADNLAQRIKSDTDTYINQNANMTMLNSTVSAEVNHSFENYWQSTSTSIDTNFSDSFNGNITTASSIQQVSQISISTSQLPASIPDYLIDEYDTAFFAGNFSGVQIDSLFDTSTTSFF
ncbi:21290_t:CDS:1 [Cetraspora pellucida]|uniref:21290_t:CDS:1 n=2 Tax=Gigasporaceae TaxID=36753 RepID=A0A9N9JJV7_9GLOM|nr:21290_t:CDS:1 [Cetraspora pellucida]